MSRTITDLRDHLFDAIERIKPTAEGGTPTMDVKQVEAVCLAAKRLIETAEVELKAVDLMGVSPSALPFFEPIRQAALPAQLRKPAQIK